MLARPVVLVGAPEQAAQTEVAVRDERAHRELLGQRQRAWAFSRLHRLALLLRCRGLPSPEPQELTAPYGPLVGLGDNAPSLSGAFCGRSA